MRTLARFETTRFQPVPGELDQGSEDFINPGRFARQLADFLRAGLADHGYGIARDIVEDWGIWLEIEQAGPVTVAVCCGNVTETEHVVFTEPSNPRVRRWFRTRDVSAELTALVAALDAILRGTPGIDALEWEEPD